MMRKILSFQINRRQIQLSVSLMALITIACGCFLTRAGLNRTPATFKVAPSLVCAAAPSTDVTVSWNDEPQIADCTTATASPGLTGCDPFTEFFFGCYHPPPQCKQVSLASTDASHDTTIPSDQLSGDRSFSIYDAATFSLTDPRNSVELASPVSVGLYNGIPDDESSEDRYTLEVTCDSHDDLDLKELYDRCILIAQVCNRNVFDIMVDWESNLSPSPVILAPRECLPLGIFPEIISAFELDRLGMPVISCVEPSDPGDPGMVVPGSGEGETIILPDLNDIVLGIQKGGCGIFEFGECLFTTSEPITFGPTPTPTSVPSPQQPIINTDALCWIGPGSQYEVVSSVLAGTEVDLLGVGAKAGWLVIDNPRYPGTACWLDQEDIDVDPDLDLATLQSFPVPPPPSPTPPPTVPPITGCLYQGPNDNQALCYPIGQCPVPFDQTQGACSP